MPHKAIEMLVKEYSTQGEKVCTDEALCGCVEIELLFTLCTYVEARLPPFWKTLDIEEIEPLNDVEVRTTKDDLVCRIKGMSQYQKALWSHIMYNWMHPESSNINEANAHPHKDHRKRDSTYRELSCWEHSDRTYSTGPNRILPPVEVVGAEVVGAVHRPHSMSSTTGTSFPFADYIPQVDSFIDVIGDEHCGFYWRAIY